MKIAFHSYKGGVGRTKLMVGTAALMAMQGLRVGMLDFDLDASGLATIFCADRKKTEQDELLHILRDPFRNYTRINGAMQDVLGLVAERFNEQPPSTARIRYLPTISNPKLSGGINLNDLDQTVEGLLDYVEQECGIDWLLIDVKPGYSQSASVILPNADRAVIVSRLDSQNIEGLKLVVPKLVRNRLDPILVANMVPEIPQAEERIKLLAEVCDHPVDVRIPYDPKLMFDDDITWAAAPESPIRTGITKLVETLTKQ